MASYAIGPFDLDPETAALILSLQLEDSKELFEASQAKGKSREGTLSDMELALQATQQELEQGTTFIKDRQMVRSIANAVRADEELILVFAAREEAELADRRIACRLAGAPPPRHTAPAPAQPTDDRLIDVMVSTPQIVITS